MSRNTEGPRSILKVASFWLLILVIAFFILSPIYLLIKYSISDTASINTGGAPVPLWPYHPTFRVFTYLFEDIDFWIVVLRSFIVAFSTVALSMVLGVPASYVLGRIDFPGRKIFLLSLVSVRLFPDISSVIPVAEFFIKINLYSSLTGVVLAHTLLALPYVIFIGSSAFEHIPRDIEEQAAVMGANGFQIFIKILFPLLIPGLVAAAIYTFLLSWDEFIFAHFLLDPGGKYETLTLYLKKNLSYSPPQNILAAISVCLSVPVIIFTLFVQKYMISGITGGAVK